MARTPEAAIRQLKHEYCLTIDTGRYEEWVALFTDDGRFLQGTDESYAGHEELLQFVTERFDPLFESAAHVVTNPIIDVDGDAATGQWYITFLYETHDGEVGWSHARYEDVYRAVDGEWLIAESQVIPRIDG